MAGRPVASPARAVDGAGTVVWLTGLPASGKSTLARGLYRVLRAAGYAAVVLDSDDLRRLWTPTPSYGDEERDRFYFLVGELAQRIAAGGAYVLISATAPRRAYRERLRGEVDRFAEVWLRCSLEVCAQRDPKGLYSAAERGDAPNLPGIGASYEPPAQPEVVIDSDRLDPAHALGQLVSALQRLNLVPKQLPVTQAYQA